MSELIGLAGERMDEERSVRGGDDGDGGQVERDERDRCSRVHQSLTSCLMGEKSLKAEKEKKREIYI